MEPPKRSGCCSKEKGSSNHSTSCLERLQESSMVLHTLKFRSARGRYVKVSLRRDWIDIWKAYSLWLLQQKVLTSCNSKQMFKITMLVNRAMNKRIIRTSRPCSSKLKYVLVNWEGKFYLLLKIMLGSLPGRSSFCQFLLSIQAS